MNPRICAKLLTTLAVVTALAVMAIDTTAAFAQQASITLVNCNNALCNANDTTWTLAKTPDSQSLTGDGTITWTVTATKGATTDNFITVNGFITVKNTGTADATIGNIVVNLQKPRLPGPTPPGHPCRNVPWVSAAANVATANSSDAATSANIVAAASTEVVACNALQGPSNYAVSGAQGTFTETAGSGTLEFKLGNGNNTTAFSLQPEPTLAPGESIDLLYSATFDNSVLGLADGSSVRSEVIVTFGNSGRRGGSGSSATNIDIDGDGSINTTDEALVRSVPCRVTSAIPTLENGNSTVSLSDKSDDVTVTGTGVAVSNFSTDIGGGDGDEDIYANTVRNVSVDETCTPPGAATVNNTAHLDGASSTVTVLGSINPDTGLPFEYTFTCVAGVALDDGANAGVTCDAELPPPPGLCTYTKGAYAGSGAPGQLLTTNFSTYYSTSPLRIGIEATDPIYDAEWDTVGAFSQGHTPVCTGLKCYLHDQEGTPGALTGDSLNATSTGGGVLPAQVATLTLNVDLAIKLVSGTPTVGQSSIGTLGFCHLTEGSTIGSWTLTQAQADALNAKTVSNVLSDANNIISTSVDVTTTIYGSYGNLNQLVTALNEAFDNCVSTPFAQANLCQ